MTNPATQHDRRLRGHPVGGAARAAEGRAGVAGRGVESARERGIGWLVNEFRRRRTLAARPQPEGVATPAARLLIGEFASAIFPHAYAAMHGPVVVPACDAPRSVMLLPGFGSHPWRMAAMRRQLARAGHAVTDWGLGWNLGASEDRFARLLSRIERVADLEGRPVSLVGWSLGGVFAREAAKARPDLVDLVVTMGSPFSGDSHGNNAWRIYHWVAGHAVNEPPVGEDFAAKPPVPTVALWSARDGVVHRHCACGRTGERDLSIPVRCTHMGFAWHPAAIETVAGVLANPAFRTTPNDRLTGAGSAKCG